MMSVQEYINQLSPDNVKLLPADEWKSALCVGMYPQPFDPEAWDQRRLLRDSYINKIGFVIYTEEVINVLSSLLKTKKVVEVGSGSGFLSRVLSSYGITVVAVDNNKSIYVMSRTEGNRWGQIYQQDITKDAVTYLKKVNKDAPPDVIIMCWPDYDSPFAHKIAKAMLPGQILIYQGEGHYGCTGDDSFHDFVDDDTLWESQQEIADQLNEHHVQFEGIHDRWYVYKKL